MIKTLLVISLSSFAAFCISLFAWINIWRPAIIQPIAFNHKIHVKEMEMSCSDCHQKVQTAEVAGRPSLKICLECHEDEASENPEEHKIRNYDKEIPWKRLFSLSDHIYFSHRRHVVLAKISCEECHGDMGNQEKPPERALMEHTMNSCIACHDQRNVTRDCLSCHM